MVKTSAASTQRLFFALWPSASVRAQLAQALAPIPLPPTARRVAVDNLHITLVFLGHVEAQQQARLHTAVDALRFTPFTLTLDELGFWRRPRVAWWGVSIAPTPLLSWVAALNAQAHACGVEVDTRPYQPHLTFARKLNHRPAWQAPPVLTWSVQGLSLVASQTHPTGVRYIPLRHWPASGA